MQREKWWWLECSALVMTWSRDILTSWCPVQWWQGVWTREWAGLKAERRGRLHFLSHQILHLWWVIIRTFRFYCAILAPPHKLSNIALERQVSFQFTPLVTIQQSCIHYDHFFLHSRSNPLCYTQTPQQTWRAIFCFPAPNYLFTVIQTYLTHSPIVPKKLVTQNHILF